MNLARPSTAARAVLGADAVPKIVGYDLHDVDRWALPTGTVPDD